MPAQKPPIDVAGFSSARTALIGIFVLCAIAFIHLARDFLTPVVLAFFVAMTFRPAIRWLGRYGVPAWGATIGFTAVLLILALVAIYVASGPITTSIAEAPEIKRHLLEKIGWFRGYIDGLINFTEEVTNAATRVDPAPQTDATPVRTVVGFSWVALLSDLAGHPIYFVAMLCGALVVAVFLMASGDLFYAKLVRVLPTLSDKKTALRIVYDVEHDVSTYLLTVAIINAGLGVALAMVFALLAMPTPLFWALLGFLLNFIPYVGPITGISLAAVVALVSFDSMTAIVLPPLAYACLIGLETQLVTPLFLSHRLRLNSVAILLALGFWAWAWGIAGVILAVPLLVMFRVLCSRIDALSAIGEFLGESTNGAANGAATNGVASNGPSNHPPKSAVRQSSLEAASAD